MRQFTCPCYTWGCLGLMLASGSVPQLPGTTDPGKPQCWLKELGFCHPSPALSVVGSWGTNQWLQTLHRHHLSLSNKIIIKHPSARTCILSKMKDEKWLPTLRSSSPSPKDPTEPILRKDHVVDFYFISFYNFTAKQFMLFIKAVFFFIKKS